MNINQPVVLVIASVLKPVDEVRMYKKFAKSLSRTGKYAVNIIGFRSQDLPPDASVQFYPLFDFSRLHWRRLTANYTFYCALKKVAPQVLILTTPELYPAAWWYCCRFRVSLVYDVVENYGRNVRHNRGFAAWLTTPLARLTEAVERRLLANSALLLLAERGYAQELQLPDTTPIEVVENKALTPRRVIRRRKLVDGPLSLIYTGTVSEVYGIELALNLVASLVEQENLLVTLTVLGHVPRATLHRRLQAYARHHPWLTLRTSDVPVPHDDIISLIQRADFGIVSHQPVPSIAHCFPTRIWEYMAYRLPFLLQDHPYWTDYCRPWQCAVPVDFSQPNVSEVKQRMLETTFYPRGVPNDIYWDGEAAKLITALDELSKNLLRLK